MAALQVKMSTPTGTQTLQLEIRPRRALPAGSSSSRRRASPLPPLDTSGQALKPKSNSTYCDDKQQQQQHQPSAARQSPSQPRQTNGRLDDRSRSKNGADTPPAPAASNMLDVAAPRRPPPPPPAVPAVPDETRSIDSSEPHEALTPTSASHDHLEPFNGVNGVQNGHFFGETGADLPEESAFPAYGAPTNHLPQLERVPSILVEPVISPVRTKFPRSAHSPHASPHQTLHHQTQHQHHHHHHHSLSEHNYNKESTVDSGRSRSNSWRSAAEPQRSSCNTPRRLSTSARSVASYTSVTSANSATAATSSPPSPTSRHRSNSSALQPSTSHLSPASPASSSRASSRRTSFIDQYAPRPDSTMGVSEGQTKTRSRPVSRIFTFSSRARSPPSSRSPPSPRSSPSGTPPSPRSPRSSVRESVRRAPEPVAAAPLTKTAASSDDLYPHTGPRHGITWAGAYGNNHLQVPIQPRKRSASTDEASRLRKPNEKVVVEERDEDEPETTLQPTFSTRVTEGVGLKARRLSLTLPEDFVVMTKDLEKEYKSGKFLHSKGDIVGRGSTAKVSKMLKRDGPKDELYAVKEFRGREKDESAHEYSQKIKSEYTLANSVNHPNIVRTFELCTDKNKRYNHVMEFCPHELYDLVHKGLFRLNKPHYDLDARLCFFKQLLRAVAYLHEHGIAHRDIKLENILMDGNGYLKLTDFGVSEVFSGEHPGARSSGGRCGHNMGANRMCAPGICGSLPYISPEVLSRDRAYDPTKLDSWSLGVVWMVLSCGGNLWMRPSEDNENYKKFITGWRKWLEEHPDGVINDENGAPRCGAFMKFAGPPAMKKLILKMMHPDPDKRISVHEALNSSFIKSVQCCSPESWEDTPTMIDATKAGPKAVTKQFKHNHIPPREHKTPEFLKHRFEMGHGWS